MRGPREVGVRGPPKLSKQQLLPFKVFFLVFLFFFCNGDHHQRTYPRISCLPRQTKALLKILVQKYPLNMTNGPVGSSSLENSFGMSTLPAGATLCLTAFLTASLGVTGGRTAYVPPHLRNQQRAASTPSLPIAG